MANSASSLSDCGADTLVAAAPGMSLPKFCAIIPRNSLHGEVPIEAERRVLPF